ncbi:MAG TPA: cysteine hydrolase [Vicinamibacterales bacterium]|nr:cysteine hydrolase [Vicinamibacterales bacterium]
MKRAYGLDVPETLAEALDPDRTALIVYDMQVGIMRQLQNAAEITAKVGDVLAAARDGGIRTYFLRHTSLPKNLMGVFQLRQALAWQRKTSIDEIQPWFLRGSEAHEIVPELAPWETEAVFDKIGMSAFEGTPLDTALRDCGIRTFIIAGVAIEIGIEPTVRQGADLGYLPVVVEDACGAGHEEAGRRAFASLRYMGDAIITSVAEVTTVLRDRNAGIGGSR